MNNHYFNGKVEHLKKLGTTCPKKLDIALVRQNFPMKHGKFSCGSQIFSLDELRNAQHIQGGSMNAVFVLRERKKVLKFNKPGILTESYSDIHKQLDKIRSFQEEYPDKALCIPKTQVFQSKEDPESYVVIAEYIEGRHLTMKDVYDNDQIRTQLLDLMEAFSLLRKDKEYPITLDLMGAKQGIWCALYGLEVINDFELANIMITKEKKLVLVDTGLSHVPSLGYVRRFMNRLSSIGQVLTAYHIKKIASGEKESFIR